MKRNKKEKKQPKVLNILLVLIFIINMNFSYKLGLVTPIVGIILIIITALALYFKRKFLKILLLVLFSLSSTVTGATNYFLSSLTQKDEVVTSYLITLKDNPVNNIDEIATDEKIGMQSESSIQGYQMFDEFFKNNNHTFEYQHYESYLLAANDLYTGNINYIVIDSTSNSELNSYYPDFKNETKIIKEASKKSKVKTTNKNVKKQAVNILLTGGDSRDGSLSGRSDTIMIATINPTTQKVQLTSIPRDSYINNTCTGYYDKITHVSNGGINCLISTLEAELSIPIDYYAKVNFESVIDIVDAVGGITVDVDQAFCAQDENDNIDAYCFEQGQKHMNGSEALAYARERKSFSDGDNTRIVHQQQVMEGILNQVSSTSLLNMDAIISSLVGSVSTNMSTTQITNLVKVYQSSDNIEYSSMYLKGTGDYVDIPELGLYSTSVQIIDETSRTEVSNSINEMLK